MDNAPVYNDGEGGTCTLSDATQVDFFHNLALIVTLLSHLVGLRTSGYSAITPTYTTTIEGGTLYGINPSLFTNDHIAALDAWFRPLAPEYGLEKDETYLMDVHINDVNKAQGTHLTIRVKGATDISSLVRTVTSRGGTGFPKGKSNALFLPKVVDVGLYRLEDDQRSPEINKFFYLCELGILDARKIAQQLATWTGQNIVSLSRGSKFSKLVNDLKKKFFEDLDKTPFTANTVLSVEVVSGSRPSVSPTTLTTEQCAFAKEHKIKAIVPDNVMRLHAKRVPKKKQQEGTTKPPQEGKTKTQQEHLAPNTNPGGSTESKFF